MITSVCLLLILFVIRIVGQELGKTGTCSDISSCVGARRQLNLGRIPEHCGWSERLVCCQDLKQLSMRPRAPVCGALQARTTRKRNGVNAWDACISFAASVEKCIENKKTSANCLMVWHDQCTHVPKHFPIGEKQVPKNVNEFPYLVDFWLKTDDASRYYYARQGCLLSDRWIISYAGEIRQDWTYTFVLGDDLAKEGKAAGVHHKVLLHIIHPEYDSNSGVNNVMLWKTQERLELSSSARPACVQVDSVRPTDRLLVTVYRKNANETEFKLQKQTWEERELSNCREQHSNLTWLQDDLHSCAWTGVDSWGFTRPLIMAYSRDVYCAYNLVGLVYARFEPRTRYIPYTKVSAYTSWIESYIWL